MMKEALGTIVIFTFSSVVFFTPQKEIELPPLPTTQYTEVHLLTTNEVIKCTELYYDCKRTKWYLDQTDKMLAEENEQNR